MRRGFVGGKAAVRVLAMGGLLFLAAAALSACKQASGSSGIPSSLSGATASAPSAAASASAPASLMPGSSGTTVTQALAGNAGFVNMVDKQGVSWSVQVGTPYNAASGHLCKPLRMTSLSRAGTFDRVACVDDRGIWTMIAPLQGSAGGPSF